MKWVGEDIPHGWFQLLSSCSLISGSQALLSLPEHPAYFRAPSLLHVSSGFFWLDSKTKMQKFRLFLVFGCPYPAF